MNNNKTALVPRLRFPKFAINGAINFETGDVIFEPISNKNHNSDLPVLAITQEHGAIPRDQIDYNVSVTDKSLESYKVVEIGDFIISLRSFQGGIEYSLYHGICSPAYIILRKRVPIVDQYYKYYFKTGRFIQDLNKDLEGIRDGKMVSYSQFSAIMLPKPDRKEQQKIADCLSSIDDLIAAEGKKLEALRAHKKGLMQKLFPVEGKTVPQVRFEGYTDTWERRKLGEIAHVTKLAGFEFTKYIEYSDNGKVIALRGLNVKNNNLVLDDVKYIDNSDFTKLSRSKLYKGDIIFTYVGTVGQSAIIPDDDKYYLAPNVARIRVNTNVSPVFVNQQMGSSNFYNTIISPLIATSSQPALSMENVRKFEINLPSLAEQTAIGEFFQNIDELLIAQVEKIETLTMHKKGLMQGLFPSIEEVGE